MGKDKGGKKRGGKNLAVLVLLVLVGGAIAGYMKPAIASCRASSGLGCWASQ